MDRITKDELDKAKDLEGTVVLDVRSTEEYDENHLEGSINIPNSELDKRIEELDKDKDYYVVCGSGMRSMTATMILKANDIKAHNVEGIEDLKKK